MSEAPKQPTPKPTPTPQPRREKQPPLSLRWWSFYAVIIAITALLSVQFVLTQLYPSPLTEILLFALIFISSAALVIPPSAYLNHRFAHAEWRQRDPRRLWRHSLGVGLLITVMAYLQRVQGLDWVIAGVLVGVFALLEIFLLTRN